MTWKATGASQLPNLVFGESGDRRSHIKANREPVSIDERFHNRIHPDLYRRFAAIELVRSACGNPLAGFSGSSGVRGAPSFWASRFCSVAWSSWRGSRAVLSDALGGDGGGRQRHGCW